MMYVYAHAHTVVLDFLCVRYVWCASAVPLSKSILLLGTLSLG